MQRKKGALRSRPRPTAATKRDKGKEVVRDEPVWQAAAPKETAPEVPQATAEEILQGLPQAGAIGDAVSSVPGGDDDGYDVVDEDADPEDDDGEDDDDEGDGFQDSGGGSEGDDDGDTEDDEDEGPKKKSPPTRQITREERELSDAGYFLSVNAEKVALAEEEGGDVTGEELPGLDGIRPAGDMPRGGASKRRSSANEEAARLDMMTKHGATWADDLMEIMGAHAMNLQFGSDNYPFVTPAIVAKVQDMSMPQVHAIAEMCRRQSMVQDKMEQVKGGGVLTELAITGLAYGVEYGVGENGANLADMRGYTSTVEASLRTPQAKRLTMRIWRTNRHFLDALFGRFGVDSGTASDVGQLGALMFEAFKQQQTMRALERGVPDRTVIGQIAQAKAAHHHPDAARERASRGMGGMVEDVVLKQPQADVMGSSSVVTGSAGQATVLQENTEALQAWRNLALRGGTTGPDLDNK